MDNITGTAQADSFVATQSTFQATDTLAGGAGVDTLSIVDSGTTAWTLPAASVSGIENINIRNVNGGATPVAQVTKVTIAATPANAADTVVVNYGGLSQTVTTGASATTAAAAVAAGINALAGATIATSALGVVTVTAPVAGTALPTISLSTYKDIADAAGNTVAITTANVAGSGGTDTVAAGGFVGATNFNSDRSTTGLTITGLAQDQQIGVIGDGATANGALTATYNAKVTSATLNVSNGTTAGAVTINGNGDNLLTTLNINSNGAANTLGGIAAPAGTTTVNIAGTTGLKTGGITNVAASTAINVTATGVVDLGTLATNVATVTETGTGGLTATLSAVTQKVSGGSGVNTITTGGVLTTGSVTAGAGTTDKLIVAAAADVAATPAAKYTGFEILQNNAAATIDASLVSGITSVVINNAGASGFTNLSATQAGAVSAIASTAGSTLALKDASGTADVVNLKASSTTAGVDVTNLIVAGVETLNFTNSSTAADTLSFDGTSSTGKGLKNITLAGAKGVTLDLAAQNTPAHDTTIVSIDASGLTAQATGTNTFTLKDTVGGAAMKSGTITGSAGDDVFSLGGTTGTNTFASGVVQAISGGAGNDNLTVSLGQLYTAGSGWITFDGGDNATAGDTLTISDTTAGTVNDNVFANIKNVENLALSDTGAMTLVAGAGFKAAFANGVTITNGATTSNAVTADFTVATGAVKFTNVGTTGVQTITGGTGADTLTITSAAAGNASKVAIAGGAGNDTIKWTDASTISAAIGTVNGGAGADKITLALKDNASASSFATITVNPTESSVGAADTVTGFYVGAANTRLADTIDFAGNAIKPAAAIAATAVTGETLTSLQFTVTTAGLLSFTGTKAATLSAAQVESIWTNQISTLLNNLETVVWADATVGDAQVGNSLVFNKNTLGDSEVILVGVQAVAVGAAAVTANIVGIA